MSDESDVQSTREHDETDDATDADGAPDEADASDADELSDEPMAVDFSVDESQESQTFEHSVETGQYDEISDASPVDEAGGAPPDAPQGPPADEPDVEMREEPATDAEFEGDPGATQVDFDETGEPEPGSFEDEPAATHVDFEGEGEPLEADPGATQVDFDEDDGMPDSEPFEEASADTDVDVEETASSGTFEEASADTDVDVEDLDESEAPETFEGEPADAPVESTEGGEPEPLDDEAWADEPVEGGPLEEPIESGEEAPLESEVAGEPFEGEATPVSEFEDGPVDLDDELDGETELETSDEAETREASLEDAADVDGEAEVPLDEAGEPVASELEEAEEASESSRFVLEAERQALQQAPEPEPVDVEPLPDPDDRGEPATLAVHREGEERRRHLLDEDRVSVGIFEKESDSASELDLSDVAEDASIWENHVTIYRHDHRYTVCVHADGGTQWNDESLELGSRRRLEDGDFLILGGSVGLRFERP
jgi:hypothetical protein